MLKDRHIYIIVLAILVHLIDYYCLETNILAFKLLD
jgi:hypothetical protein